MVQRQTPCEAAGARHLPGAFIISIVSQPPQPGAQAAADYTSLLREAAAALRSALGPNTTVSVVSALAPVSAACSTACVT